MVFLPRLDDIWGTSNNSTLDNIWGTPSAQGNSRLDSIWGSNQQSIQDSQERTIGDIAGEVGSALMAPASLALDAISYLDKPRGALAGAVKAIEENRSIQEGAHQGWRENTSWKDAMSDQWVKDNPILSKVAGFATDVVLDPMWLLPPAKIAKGVAAGSKAIGLTEHVINPAIKAIEDSSLGKRAIAGFQDFSGYNRLADVQDEFKSGRATDQVLGQDVIDELNNVQKANPSMDMSNVTRYVEAKDRDLLTNTTIPSERAGIVSAAEDGSLAKAIREGTVTKDQAFNVLRDEGKEIPEYLLQEHQRASLSGQSEQLANKIKDLQQEIAGARFSGETDLADKWTEELKALRRQSKDYAKTPDYTYRDDVLNAIPDENIRNRVQAIGDKIVELNKKYSQDLLGSGRLSDEQYVRFIEGSHLRRSFTQYENPEKFLEEVKKNGTPEEWERVYADYQRMTKNSGFGATHKVDMKQFTGRQVLSDETLQKMGVINSPQYRVMDTINRGSKALREDEFLSKVDAMFGKTQSEAAALSRDLPVSRQYVPIPDTKAYGALAGKWVPRDVANQVMGTLGTKPDNLNQTLQKVVSWWKVGKLANPASIMRNLYSGLPMANVFGNVPMYSLPKQMAKVTQQFLAEGGKNSPLIRELRQTGILDNVWNRQELSNILGENPKGVKWLADKGMQAFGAPDQFWRAVVYSHHRDAGKSIQEAAKIANRALFDYSRAPEWVNWLSKSGMMPFAKFPYFAAKETAKALWERPAQVTKYIKPQNQVNTEDREQIMPDYLKAKTLLPLWNSERMVNGKPQKVQKNLDVSYILPFANDINFGNPLFDLLQLYRTGRNSIGQDVIKPGMTGGEKTAIWANQLWNSFGPSLPLPYNYAGDKLSNAFQEKTDSKGRQYGPGDAVSQVLFGLKNVPVNVDELYQQKMAKFKRDQNDIQSMMKQIARDQSLTTNQKREQLIDHQRQLKNLTIEARKTQEAYKREKQKGAS